MPRGIPQDLTGKKYGKITVIDRAGHVLKGGANLVAWNCVCDCGGTKVLPTHYITKGTASCGCMVYLGATVRITNMARFYGVQRLAAGKRDKEFNLTLEEFEALSKGDCTYCGIEPLQVFNVQRKSKAILLYNGIDRVDSTKGYISGNCVSCCSHCNAMKLDLTHDQFVAKVTRVYHHLSGLDKLPAQVMKAV